jgi:hypothetical protein
MGELLTIERAKFPERGPNAKGWGELLQQCSISQPAAWQWMDLWKRKDEFSLSDNEMSITEAYYLTGIWKKKELPELEPEPTPELPLAKAPTSWTAPEVAGDAPAGRDEEEFHRTFKNMVTKEFKKFLNTFPSDKHELVVSKIKEYLRVGLRKAA